MLSLKILTVLLLPVLLFLPLHSFQLNSNIKLSGDSNIEVPGNPTQSVYAPDLGKLYITEFDENSVAVLDTSTDNIIKTIEVGTNPFGNAYDAPAHKVFVANSGSKDVSVIDAKTDALVDTITLDEVVQGVAYNPITGWVMVTCLSDNSVVEISDTLDVVVRTIPVGDLPVCIAIDVNNGNCYVANYGSDSISMIDGQTGDLSWTTTVGTNPEALTVDPSSSNLFVANVGSNSVSVLNDITGSTLNQIGGISKPDGITIDSLRGYIYVNAAGSNSLQVLDLSDLKTIGDFSVGSDPEGVTVGGARSEIYVCNRMSNSLSALFIGIDFVESGLPSGTTWGVQVIGTSLSSGSKTVFFPGSFGNYSYIVNKISGFAPNILEGSIYVDGNVTCSVRFSPVTPNFLQSIFDNYLIPWYNALASLPVAVLIVISLVPLMIEVAIPLVFFSKKDAPNSKEIFFILIAIGAVSFSYFLQVSTSVFSYLFRLMLTYNPFINNIFANLAVAAFVGVVIVGAIAFYIGSLKNFFPEYIALALAYVITHLVLSSELSLANLLQFSWVASILTVLAVLVTISLSLWSFRQEGRGNHIRFLPVVFLGAWLDIIALPFFTLICLFYIPISITIALFVFMRSQAH